MRVRCGAGAHFWTALGGLGYDPAMTADFTANICGGARFFTHPGGVIEVEGLGVPIVQPGDAKFLNLSRTWQNFGAILGPAADRAGLPRDWLLAFATVETGFLSANKAAQSAAVSPAGALGVLQLMPQYFTQYSPAELLEPSININASAAFIKKLCARSSAGCPYACELPYLGSVYNAGSGSGCVQCGGTSSVFGFVEEGDYSLALVTYNNAALTYLSLGGGALPWLIGGAVVAGAGAAAWLWL